MKSIIKILTLASLVQAFDSDTVTMFLKKSNQVNFQFARCNYSTFDKQFITSIMIKGSQYNCPRIINYNPVTLTWTEKK